MTNDIDTQIRVFVYDHLMAHGNPPAVAEIASHLSLTLENAKTRLAGLRIGKTILVHPVTGEIWMAGPFSSSRTQYRVIGSRTSWWANCAWDMLGVAMIAGESVRIDTSCTDCDDPWTLTAPTHAPPAQEGIVHFLLPARKWYEDIGFT